MMKKLYTSIFHRLRQLRGLKIFHMYYVEPIVFILLFAHSLSGTIMRNQIIYQACTTVLLYNESDCQQLGTKNSSEYANKIETEIQPYVANLFMIRTLLESIVPAICGIFIGSWSDHYGRKPLLVISMIGFSFTYVIAAVICEISYYYPVNPWYYVLAVVPHSLLGGNCVFSVAAFCFISDVTDTKTRPYRMIFMEAFFFVGLMAGSLLSSYIYAATNAPVTFSISGVSMYGATVFIVICVPESLHLSEKPIQSNECDAPKCTTFELDIDPMASCKMEEDNKTAKGNDSRKEAQSPVTDSTADAQGNKENDGKDESKTEVEPKSGKMGLFSYSHIMVTCFKKRPLYDRCIIWLVTGSMFLSIFVLDGAMRVFYLFVREKFHWTVRDFTFYETVSHMVPMFGALVGFLILRKVFGLSVVALAILAFFSDIISSIARGVASEDWHLYHAVALGAFKSVGDGAMRVFYLFVREKFHWTVRDFTFYETVSHMVPMFGALVGFLILRKVFGLSVVALAILAFFSDIISIIARGVASEDWHLYHAVALGAFKSVGGPLCRTIVSNIVPATDLGKKFSIKNVLQSIAPFLAAPLYTLVYKESLTTFITLRFKYSYKEHYANILK